MEPSTEPGAEQSVTVTRQIDLDISADDLWLAITDRQMLESWLGDVVDVDVLPGAHGVVIDDGVQRRLVVDRVEHGSGWSFRWGVDGEPESTVTLAIGEQIDGGSRLTITETLSAQAGATGRSYRWDMCALLLWACTTAWAAMSIATAIVR